MDTIKFKVIQDPQTKDLSLHILRLINDGEWAVIDRFNGMTAQELKQLADYIYGLFKKKDAHD
jgi:hypothetical protein